jgi:hypothetical protein
MTEPLGESSNGLCIGDIEDGVPCFYEVPDEVLERISRRLLSLLKVVLGYGLFANGQIVHSEGLLEVIP